MFDPQNPAVEPAAAILACLRQDQTPFISSQELCRRLGVSRTAVWKQIRSLRHLGYEIGGSPHRGYRFLKAPNRPIPLEVQARLTTAELGREMIFAEEMDSTNRVAGELAENGQAAGTVVVADTQTRGRGRLDRHWFSPPGLNLYFSMILRPMIPPQQVPSLALVAGLAVTRALTALFPDLQPRLKWPNDVWLEGKKIAGILCDMRSDPDRVHYIVAGIGMNINVNAGGFPEYLAATATSLKSVLGRELSRPQILAELLNHFEPLYRRWQTVGLKPLLPELEALSLLAGQEITVTVHNGTVRGRGVGIAPSGALILEVPHRGRREILSGDVHVQLRA